MCGIVAAAARREVSEILLEGLRRLKEAGMKWARVSTAGFNTPAQALYESCGFEQAGVERTFMKKLAP